MSKRLWETKEPPLQVPELSQLPLLPSPPSSPLHPTPSSATVCSTSPSLNILPTHHTSLFLLLSPCEQMDHICCHHFLTPCSFLNQHDLPFAGKCFSPVTSDYLTDKLNYSQALNEPHSTKPPGTAPTVPSAWNVLCPPLDNVIQPSG